MSKWFEKIKWSIRDAVAFITNGTIKSPINVDEDCGPENFVRRSTSTYRNGELVFDRLCEIKTTNIRDRLDRIYANRLATIGEKFYNKTVDLALYVNSNDVMQFFIIYVPTLARAVDSIRYLVGVPMRAYTAGNFLEFFNLIANTYVLMCCTIAYLLGDSNIGGFFSKSNLMMQGTAIISIKWYVSHVVSSLVGVPDILRIRGGYFIAGSGATRLLNTPEYYERVGVTRLLEPNKLGSVIADSQHAELIQNIVFGLQRIVTPQLVLK